MSLGEKLRELRKNKGWTQEEVAKRTSLGRGYIAQLERNIVARPSADTFLKIAQAFNINERELYQAAGYISREGRGVYQVRKETTEELLDRFRITLPEEVPIYEEFTLHAGKPVVPIDYIPISRQTAKGRRLEAYITRGNCLTPEIQDGNIVVIDREGPIDEGDIVACVVGDELHIARLRKIAGELYLENNHGRYKLSEALIAAPVIEVRRKLK